MLQHAPRVLAVLAMGWALPSCETSTRPTQDASACEPYVLTHGEVWAVYRGGPEPASGCGYCCPTDPPSCDCTMIGGWSETARCSPGDCDVLRFSSGLDEHGCPFLEADTTTSCLTEIEAGSPVDGG
ncbi:MAG: hypothetical protein IT379_07675 [Deltaproteobacteria bacterium]|nr:hypothetical protein [Deltaproteobacteria bacterium]